MEEFKGTPGPWVSVDYCGKLQIQAGESYEDADILDKEDVGEEIAEANASLIEAAPDLLEACMTVVSGYEGDGMEQMGPRDEVFYRYCKEAIAKAFG